MNHLKRLQFRNTQEETFKLVEVLYCYKCYISTYLTRKTEGECNNIQNNLYSRLGEMEYSIVLT